MSEKLPENLDIPTENDLILSIQYAEQHSDGENIHLVKNFITILNMRFKLSKETGWDEDSVFKFKAAAQTLNLIASKKIKKPAPHITGFVWTSDGTPYDEKTLIN